MKKPLNLTKNKTILNKRYLSANGSSLLPLALRPRLFLWLGIVLGLSFITNNIFGSNVSAASITLTIPKDSISLTVNPNKDSGFAKSSPQTISVTTDDPVGYTLNIKAKDDNGSNALVNGINTLKSIEESVTEDDYKSNTKFTNTWGFLPNKLFNTESGTTSDNTNFIPGPTSEPIILDKTSNSNQETNDYDLTIGAKIDNTLVSGTYSNTFVITAVTNSPNMPYYMQDFKDLTEEEYNEVLSQMTLNTQYELVDERDNKTYYASKLADGNVWMTENLDLDLSTSKQLTPDDTDIPSDWTPNINIYAASVNTWDTSAAGNNKPQSYDPGNRCWNGTIYNSTDTNSLSIRSVDCLQHDQSHYHIGNYYSWSAAVAMNNASNYATDKEYPNQSICPAGWELSKYDGDKSFTNLQEKAKFTSGVGGNIHKAPFYFNYIGPWAGSANYFGYSGNYWLGVVNSGSSAYNFGVNANAFLHTTYTYGRYYGFEVRCVARTPQTYTINYNLNNGSGVSSPQNVTTNKNNLKLDSTTPTRSGYDFLGWCDKETTSDTCSGTTYPAGADYPITNTADNTITLWAIWKQNLPSLTTFKCSSLSSNATTDTTDGITIKKVGSQCWMWENYKTSRTWSQANSDCPSGWHLPSRSEFQTLLNSMGAGSQLYNAGWSDSYWSSTPNGSSLAYNLDVSLSTALVNNFYTSYGLHVRCVAQ